tara:strand:- start:1825 stop:2334 length:510 start_codon:yes stop_codon:yes gene_type:complete
MLNEGNDKSSKHKIGKYSIIGDGVIIGDNVIIGPYCEIYDGVNIGKNTILQGRNRIGPNCQIGENCTLKNGATLTNHTTLENGVFLGPNSIILGDDLSRNGKNNTVIGFNTQVGAGSIIKAGKKIAPNVVIGALSFVNKDISDDGIYVGVPIGKKPISVWNKTAFQRGK